MRIHCFEDLQKPLTVKQIIKAIHQNTQETLFSFGGLDTQTDTFLKKYLVLQINKKYGSNRLSQDDRERKAGKNIIELQAYDLIKANNEQLAIKLLIA
jgi:hypothetical protein